MEHIQSELNHRFFKKIVLIFITVIEYLKCHTFKEKRGLFTP